MTFESLSQAASKLVHGNLHMSNVLVEVAGVAFGAVNPLSCTSFAMQTSSTSSVSRAERTLLYPISENP